MAFLFNVMAFPVTGRSQLLGVPMAWPRHFLRPKRHLAMASRRRHAMETPSNWERHNIKWERHNIKFSKTLGWGGAGWGGISLTFPLS